MRYYPIFVDLRGKPVLVVGGGRIALRRSRILAAAGAKITVIAPDILPEFEALPLRTVSREFHPGDAAGQFLVFAATNQRDVNAAVARECRELGILVNVADRRGECAFLVPARVMHRGAHIAISTEGRDPARAAALRRRFEALLEERRVESE